MTASAPASKYPINVPITRNTTVKNTTVLATYLIRMLHLMHKIGFLLGVKVLTARIALEPLQCEACQRPFAEFVPEDVVTKMRWGRWPSATKMQWGRWPSVTKMHWGRVQTHYDLLFTRRLRLFEHHFGTMCVATSASVAADI